MPRPLITDNALRYQPDNCDYAFTWVRRDPQIGAQAHIYVWPNDTVGEGKPAAQIGVWKWDGREQAPTTLSGADDFVKRCDEWLLAHGRRRTPSWVLAADVDPYDLRMRAAAAGCPSFPAITQTDRLASLSVGGEQPPPWLQTLAAALTDGGVEATLTRAS